MQLGQLFGELAAFESGLPFAGTGRRHRLQEHPYWTTNFLGCLEGFFWRERLGDLEAVAPAEVKGIRCSWENIVEGIPKSACMSYCVFNISSVVPNDSFPGDLDTTLKQFLFRCCSVKTAIGSRHHFFKFHPLLYGSPSPPSTKDCVENCPSRRPPSLRSSSLPHSPRFTLFSIDPLAFVEDNITTREYTRTLFTHSQLHIIASLSINIT